MKPVLERHHCLLSWTGRSFFSVRILRNKRAVGSENKESREVCALEILYKLCLVPNRSGSTVSDMSL